ncbi:MAG: hypothetical protein PUC23_02055 [bacterium]|nr:hypothetical protein [bacterium]
MNEAREVLKKYKITPLGYVKNKDSLIVSSNNGKYVLKKRKDNIKEFYNYLRLRNFHYMPEYYNLYDRDSYYIESFIEDYDIPKYDRAEELINIVSLLHNKTTTYEEVDIDDYKKIYEDTLKEINDLVSYYNELNNYIDTEIYMSPSNYLLVRNISKIYASLDFCKNELDSWYEKIKNSKKERKVLIHNNLSLDHLLRNEEGSFLISWDNARYDIPIFDIYKLYQNIYDDVDFESLFELYNSKYPLHEDELKLLFILISIPKKIDFSDDEYDNCKKVDYLLNYIIKTEKIISPYYTNEENKNE